MSSLSPKRLTQSRSVVDLVLLAFSSPLVIERPQVTPLQVSTSTETTHTIRRYPSQMGETFDQQLQGMAESLQYLIKRLEDQADQCTTLTAKRHIGQLLKDARKQAIAIAKLQDSVEDTRTVMAKSTQALDNSVVEKAASTRHNSLASDISGMLSQAISGPFQQRARLVKRNRSIELSMPIKLWKRNKAGSQSARSSQDEPRHRPASIVLSTNTAPSLTDDASDYSSQNDTASDSNITNDCISDEPKLAEAEDAIEELHELYKPVTSSSCYSTPSISIEDWNALMTPSNCEALPPPLPRRSSRRIFPRATLPSWDEIPPVPAMPLTPPPSVPEMAELSSSKTHERMTLEILSSLEQRFTLTMWTPPTTP